MKRYLLLLLLAVSFLGCKKKNSVAPPDLPFGPLSGTWEKTAEASLSSYYIPPKHMILKLTGNTYERYVEGVLVKKGTYRLTKAMRPNNTEGDRIIFDNDVAAKKCFYSFTLDNELAIAEDPYVQPPGGLIFYKKLN